MFDGHCEKSGFQSHSAWRSLVSKEEAGSRVIASRGPRGNLVQTSFYGWGNQGSEKGGSCQGHQGSVLALVS